MFGAEGCSNKLTNYLRILITVLIKQKKESVNMNTEHLTLSSKNSKMKKSMKRTERNHKRINIYIIRVPEEEKEWDRRLI